MSSTILDLAIFGHPVLDEKMNHICRKIRGLTPSINFLKEVLEMLRLAIKNRSIHKEMMELVSDLKINVNFDDSPLENYEKIEAVLAKLPYVLNRHAQASSLSVFYQVVAMNILLEGSKSEY